MTVRQRMQYLPDGGAAMGAVAAPGAPATTAYVAGEAIAALGGGGAAPGAAVPAMGVPATGGGGPVGTAVSTCGSV
jgi:hypothetical protein